MSNFKQFIAKEIIEALDFNDKYLKLLTDEKIDKIINILEIERLKRKRPVGVNICPGKHIKYINEWIELFNLRGQFDVFCSYSIDTPILLFAGIGFEYMISVYNNQFVKYNGYEHVYEGSWDDYPLFIEEVRSKSDKGAVNLVNEFLLTHPNYDGKHDDLIKSNNI